MMDRPSYLSKYLFDWELMDVIVGGRSALDSKFFIIPMYNADEVTSFIKNYGLDPTDPVVRAELFGNFQEALQFIRRYFLVSGVDGAEGLMIPPAILRITSIEDLFLYATGNTTEVTLEERLWAEVVLKIMHTILHIDKDLRGSYFSKIQTQIFDRFYQHVYRDENDNLFLGKRDDEKKIPLVEFVTKSKKSRESVIIKLLHKTENVAEELFDRIGVRFVTESRADVLRCISYLLKNNIIIPHNLKASRSNNTLIDLEKFKERHKQLIKMSIRNKLSEERFLQALERDAVECTFDSEESEDEDIKNKHTSSNYQAIQFTSRQLIRYKNPFLEEFRDLRKLAKERESEEGEEDELGKRILGLDMSHISRDIRFFYPYEVQLVDKRSHEINTQGEASHQDYKKSQVQSAFNRVFWAILRNRQDQNI
jgi:uncharacterized protein (TIGR04562 family)